MKKKLLFLLCILIAGSAWFWLRPSTKTNDTKQPITTKAFDKMQYSLTDPVSLWVVVNKRRPLSPSNYTPADLRAPNVPLRLTAKNTEMQLRTDAASALETMVAAAKQADIELMVSSAYRSYSFQSGLYNQYVARQGRVVADQQSARAGHSEHQTGLAVDVEPTSRKCEVEECFARLPEGRWTAKNAYEYGFIIRYPENKQATTGYIYEPWHLRYVGTALASELHKAGNPTLEDFFAVGPAPDYKR